MKDDAVMHKPTVKAIHTIRKGGNVGAHGWFSSSSGELIDLEEEEVLLLFEIVEKFYNDLEIDLPKSQALKASIDSKHQRQ